MLRCVFVDIYKSIEYYYGIVSMKRQSSMSIWSYKKAVMQSELSSSTKIVLVALDMHVNDMGDPAFPSYSRLATLTSLSSRSVKEHVGVAEDAGWLKREKRFSKEGRQQSNLFYLQVPHHLAMTSNAADEPEGELGGGESGSPMGEGGSPPGVKQVHPEVTIGKNHSKETKRAIALPATFAVTDEMRKWATENGLTAPDDLIDSFRDYHLAKGSTYKDWTAAFRTWIRNDKRFASSRTARPASGKSKPLDDMDYSAPLF
jgi:hypothetical protein